MNIFTRFLAQNSDDASLTTFIAYWDRLEAVVIQLFREKGVTAVDEAEHREVRAYLLRGYADWQRPLAEHWPQALVGGQPAATDPFAALLAPKEAREFVGNWLAMQQLPAAREALNQLIVQRQRT